MRPRVVYVAALGQLHWELWDPVRDRAKQSCALCKPAASLRL